MVVVISGVFPLYVVSGGTTVVTWFALEFCRVLCLWDVGILRGFPLKCRTVSSGMIVGPVVGSRGGAGPGPVGKRSEFLSPPSEVAHECLVQPLAPSEVDQGSWQVHDVRGRAQEVD
eukprot:scaffold110967_cov52-Attheya_sp.AAC.1